MPTPSSQTSSFRMLCCRGTLATTTLLLGALLLSPFFARAQPAPPSAPAPIPTPGPTATPTPPYKPTPFPAPIHPPAQQPPATTKTPAPSPTPVLASTKQPLPTPTPRPSASASATPSPSPTPRATPTQKNENTTGVGVDLSLRPIREMESVGQKVINATGANQRLAQSLLPGTRARAVFAVRLANTGKTATTYAVTAPAGGAGWKVTYFDAVEGGEDITASIIGKAGWTTSLIQPGETREFRVEATPDADNVGAAFRDLLIRASAVGAPKIIDAVVAGACVQKVAGIEYSLDQGEHWKAAPLLEESAGAGAKTTNSSSLISKAGIPVMEGRMIGLRAVRLLPAFPWPFEPDIKPLWHDAGYWNVGNTMWVQAKVTQEMISVECGNTLHTRLFVSPDTAKKAAPDTEDEPQVAKVKAVPSAKKFDLDLDASRPYIHVGGGSAGQTTLVATVKDGQGNPLPGLRVRFRTYYSEDTPEGKPLAQKTAAGTLGGDGPNHDLATTDKEGVARILLTSSERESAVIFEADLVLEGTARDGDEAKESLQFPAQIMQFFDDHPEPTIDDDF